MLAQAKITCACLRSAPFQSPRLVAAMWAEQIQAVMTQIQQLVGVFGQCSGSCRVSSRFPRSVLRVWDHVKARKLIDTRIVKIPFFPGEGKDYEDWSFAFERAMRAASLAGDR